MSDHIYEARTMDAWHTYVSNGGTMSFEQFYTLDWDIMQQLI